MLFLCVFFLLDWCRQTYLLIIISQFLSSASLRPSILSVEIGLMMTKETLHIRPMTLNWKERKMYRYVALADKLNDRVDHRFDRWLRTMNALRVRKMSDHFSWKGSIDHHSRWEHVYEPSTDINIDSTLHTGGIDSIDSGFMSGKRHVTFNYHVWSMDVRTRNYNVILWLKFVVEIAAVRTNRIHVILAFVNHICNVFLRWIRRSIHRSTMITMNMMKMIIWKTMMNSREKSIFKIIKIISRIMLSPSIKANRFEN